MKEPMRRIARPIRIVSLAASLFAFWLLLSGHYTAWFIGAGILAAIAVAAASWRADAVDREGYPSEWIVPAIRYWPWLIGQIAISAFGVARIIVNPKLPVAPRFLTVPASQKTAVGIATYANSITLTPGTIAVEVHRRPGEILVHALTEETAAGVLTGAMDRLVTEVEAA